MTVLETGNGPLWLWEYGSGSPRIVALHGFTLHGGSFAPLAAVVGETMLAPDLPGHGRTRVEPVTLDTAVNAIAELLDQLEAPPILLGYSQGGRIALRVAIDRPDLIGALVLVSTSPGLSGSERTRRRIADEALASRIERIGAKRFIDEWLANPVTSTDRVPDAARQADRTMRLENDASGLAAALRGMGQATLADMRDQLAALTMPVRFLAGHRDLKYLALAQEMAGLSHGKAVTVPGAGHNVILENPEAVAGTLRAIVNRQSG
jgi:2-succinyl-6-hydroxy-2,4-cyclohexadiene-1-carboxylate synthase